MDESIPPQKKGLGPLAWIGIGCGGIVVLAVIGVIVFSLMFGDKIKQFAEDAQKNPTRAAASVLVTTGVGDMVKEDDANLRYTVKEKKTGKLTTIYFDEKTKQPAVVEGDFSAIPAPASSPAPAPQ